MNIFFLHILPQICAEMHIDKHVVKMILETTQLLCSAHYMANENNTPIYTPCYKLTHKNHPSSIWTRESKENYKWLCELGKELCKDINTHIVSRADVHCEVLFFESFGQPCHTDAMCSADVSHRRVLASAHDLGSSLVILEEFSGQ